VLLEGPGIVAGPGAVARSQPRVRAVTPQGSTATEGG